MEREMAQSTSSWRLESATEPSPKPADWSHQCAVSSCAIRHYPSITAITVSAGAMNEEAIRCLSLWIWMCSSTAPTLDAAHARSSVEKNNRQVLT
uniref:Uncharacterized protein n=1 Tax=Zea mays TaxID=4577 RepID=C0HI92_MAIZE|nr:unknown [Zea mays]